MNDGNEDLLAAGGVIVAIILAFGFVAWLLAKPAAAQEHMNPAHWYDASCCSQNDCKPVGCDMLSDQIGGGVLDTSTGISFRRDQVHPSKDSRCHACVSPHTNAPYCVYVQQGS